MSICALCLKNDVLRQSHYISAAFFRRIYSFQGPQGKPPISFDGDVAIFNERQAKAPLLCPACEHLFKIRGEDWAIDCSAKPSGAFKLRDFMLKTLPDPVSSPVPVYLSCMLPQFRHEELTYFAASVFWRGTAFDWRVPGHEMSRLNLPEDVCEQLRLYLLDRSCFPSNCRLALEVSSVSLLKGVCFPVLMGPMIIESSEALVSFFHVFGLTFTLVQINRPEGLTRRMLSLAEHPYPMFLSDISSTWYRERIREKRSIARPVGRLAKFEALLRP